MNKYHCVKHRICLCVGYCLQFWLLTRGATERKGDTDFLKVVWNRWCELEATNRVTKAVHKAVVELLFTKLCNIKIAECLLRFDLGKKGHKGNQPYAVCWYTKLHRQIIPADSRKQTRIKSVTDVSGIGRDVHFTSCNGTAVNIGESEENGCQKMIKAPVLMIVLEAEHALRLTSGLSKCFCFVTELLLFSKCSRRKTSFLLYL